MTRFESPGDIGELVAERLVTHAIDPTYIGRWRSLGALSRADMSLIADRLAPIVNEFRPDGLPTGVYCPAEVLVLEAQVYRDLDVFSQRAIDEAGSPSQLEDFEPYWMAEHYQQPDGNPQSFYDEVGWLLAQAPPGAKDILDLTARVEELDLQPEQKYLSGRENLHRMAFDMGATRRR